MMDPKDPGQSPLRFYLDSRFDRLEDKLDNQLERVTRAETRLDGMKDHLKYLWILTLGAIGKIAHITFFT